MILEARGNTIELGSRPLIMGIVNLVADSFSGDGLTDIAAAIERARQQIADGADIVDIGAESARTNRGAISEEEEAAQLLRFIERWPALRAETKKQTLLSINTWRSGVVRRVLPAGGDLLNDIGALPTDENARLCAATGAALLIMHTIGQPKVPHTHIAYDDIMRQLDDFFSEKIALVQNAGVSRNAIVLDPGIDFAKQREDNLRIYRELERLRHFERPILLPVSRKTVVGEVLGLPNAFDRDAGTVACLVWGMLAGAHLFRVHHVRAAAQAARTIDALRHGV
jgi:dihydropteroate synthase